MITGRDASVLLRVWESGASRPPSIRGLLMLSAAAPDAPPEQLIQLSVGHRNALLLSLRERTFGPTLDCLTRCPQCSESIQLAFAVADVRASHADQAASFRITAGAYTVLFRVPNCADLIALEGERELEMAERRLLARCVLEAATRRGASAAADLPRGVAMAIAERMSDLDPQAELVLDFSCPACNERTRAPFDIASFLWTEIEMWAKGMLRTIHTIAAAYGWGEADIVSLSEVRRRAYLELILA